jgi:hypothetical protein
MPSGCNRSFQFSSFPARGEGGSRQRAGWGQSQRAEARNRVDEILAWSLPQPAATPALRYSRTKRPCYRLVPQCALPYLDGQGPPLSQVEGGLDHCPARQCPCSDFPTHAKPGTLRNEKTLGFRSRIPWNWRRPMERKSIDRRLFVTGLFGVAGAGAVAALLPPSSEAIAKILTDEDPNSNILPNLDELQADPAGDTAAPEDGQQLAWHYGIPHGTRRRRRRRVRRWRRICRREWWSGAYRRRCRRRPFWIWISIG